MKDRKQYNQIIKKCDCCGKESEKGIVWSSYFSLVLCAVCEQGHSEAEIRAEAGHP
jgi:hypothetical protein